MEPIYSIKSIITEKEFIRFNRYLRYRNKTHMAIIIGCGLLVLAFVINDFIKGTNVARAVGFLVGILVVVWIYTFGADRKAKKYYHQYVVKEDINQRIDFFDNHYVQSSANANVTIHYSQITNIYATKTNIYLMRAPNIGCILSLSDCPEGFVDFITEKIIARR